MESAKKEIILAIISGLIIGGITTLFYTGALQKAYLLINKNQTKTNITTTQEALVTSPPKPENVFLELSTPNETRANTKNFLIKGKTNPFSSLLVSSENEEQISQADVNGNFSREVVLNYGINNINVVLLGTKEDLTSKIIIYYFE